MPTPGTAVQIDPSQDTNFVGPNEGHVLQVNGFRNRWGPFVIGGNLYLVAEKEGASTNDPSNIKVYKSTDSGDTWILKDSANSPQTVTHTASIASPQTGSLIRIVYITPNTDIPGVARANILQIDFDTSTDTWGSPVGSGPIYGARPDNSSGITDPRSLKLITLSDRLRLIYHNIISPNTYESLCYADFISGSWSSIDTPIFTYSDDTLLPVPTIAFRGTSDRIHIYFYKTVTPDMDGSSDGVLYWVSIDSAGTPSSVLTAAPSTETGGGNVINNIGLGTLWNNKIIVPYSYDFLLPYSFKTTTGSNETSPTFSFDQISTTMPGLFGALDFNTQTFVIDSNNVLHVFWESGGKEPAPLVQNFIYHNWNDGSGWQASDDLVFSSFSVPGHDYPCHNLNVEIVNVSGSTFTFGVMFDEIGSHTMYYTTFEWTGAGPPPSSGNGVFIQQVPPSQPLKFIPPPFVQGRLIPPPSFAAPCPPWALLLPIVYTAEIGCFCIPNAVINPALLQQGNASTFPFLFAPPRFKAPQFTFPYESTFP